MSKLLICSDIHLDDNPLNTYRWTLFPWMMEQCKNHEISNIVICGDIFHEKDRHPATLVNRFVDSLVDLLKSTNQVLMIKGNHDRIEDTTPYLRWINTIPQIRFFSSPTALKIDSRKLLFLPFSKDPESEWNEIDDKIKSSDYIFCHQTFTGACSETGMKLSGISQNIFSQTNAKIYSGDIHKSQTLGKVEYVGTPYPITFGEDCFYRTILVNLEYKTNQNLIFPCLKRHTVTITNEEDIQQLSAFAPKDQCKIKIPTSVPDIKSLQLRIDEAAKSLGIQICKTEPVSDPKPKMEKVKQTLSSTDPFDLFEEYVKADHVEDDLSEVGKILLEQTIKVNGSPSVL